MSFRVEEIVYKIKVKSQFLQGGKCGPSVFYIFFFEKNISNGFEVQDCIPGVQTLLQTPISGYSNLYGRHGDYVQKGYYGHWPYDRPHSPLAKITITAGPGTREIFDIQNFYPKYFSAYKIVGIQNFWHAISGLKFVWHEQVAERSEQKPGAKFNRLSQGLE